jgi:hypothetical protein
VLAAAVFRAFSAAAADFGELLLDLLGEEAGTTG